MNTGNSGGFSLPGYDVVPADANDAGLKQDAGEVNHVAPPPPILAPPPDMPFLPFNPGAPMMPVAEPEPMMHSEKQDLEPLHPKPDSETISHPEPLSAQQYTIPKRKATVFVDGGETPMTLDTGIDGERPHKATYKIDDDDGVISHDPVLNQNPDALERFLIEYGCVPPRISISFHGSHTERRTRIVHQSNGTTRTEHHTVTVTDFFFKVDLTKLLMDGPRVFTIPDEVPAYRGEMYKTREPDGPVDVRRRVKAESEQEDEQKNWEHQRTSRGYPPWVSRLPKPTEEEKEDNSRWDEAMRSGRNFKEWMVDYCRSRKVIKDFKFEKIVYGWDRIQLRDALDAAVRASNYNRTLAITFNEDLNQVHVMPASRLARIFSSTTAAILLSLILVYPFLWLWRRFWPDAGGKWDTCGAAFALKRWELAVATYPGETIDQVRGRLPLNWIPENQIHQVLREGPGGVWILKGTREGQWFRMWGPRIRGAILAREKHGEFIHIDDRLPEALWAEQIASGLDGY